MADLARTVAYAQQKLAAAPVAQRSPLPSPAPPAEISAETDEIDSDIAARLKRLDHDQLLQVAEALGRSVDGGDEDALRRSVADWVAEWASDAAEDSEDDPEAARAAGREEAIGGLEEEVFLALIDRDIPRDQWQAAMGVSPERLQELTAKAIDDGLLEETLVLDEPLTASDRAFVTEATS